MIILPSTGGRKRLLSNRCGRPRPLGPINMQSSIRLPYTGAQHLRKNIVGAGRREQGDVGTPPSRRELELHTNQLLLVLFESTPRLFDALAPSSLGSIYLVFEHRKSVKRGSRCIFCSTSAVHLRQSSMAAHTSGTKAVKYLQKDHVGRFGNSGLCG